MQQKAKLIDISKICIYIDFVQNTEESAKSNSTNGGTMHSQRSPSVSNGKSTADVDTQSVASFDTYDMRRSK